jgi:hypothetical protein
MGLPSIGIRIDRAARVPPSPTWEKSCQINEEIDARRNRPSGRIYLLV